MLPCQRCLCSCAGAAPDVCASSRHTRAAAAAARLASTSRTPAPPPPPAACRHLVDEAQAAMSGLTIKTSTQLLGQPPYNTFKRQALWEAQARPPARSQLLGAALPADPT